MNLPLKVKSSFSVPCLISICGRQQILCVSTRLLVVSRMLTQLIMRLLLKIYRTVGGTQGMQILKWTEAFDNFLIHTIGVHLRPLSYVTKQKVIPDELPETEEDKPHSEGSSVIEDITAYALHSHPHYNDDNAKIYCYFEEATQSTEHASALKPYQRTNNGRNALISLHNQYARQDKWEVDRMRSSTTKNGKVNPIFLSKNTGPCTGMLLSP